MVNFADLKKNSSSSFDKLNNQLKSMGKPNYSNDDDKYWKPIVDKAGNGFAVLRFLPPPVNEEMPFVRLWDHGFQGPTGKWYIEKSLTTLGLPDPVSEHNSELWATGIESNKEIVRKQKRRESYIANVYIVRDPANPSNEGKVFLYKFGKKIFEKLNDLMNPQYEGYQNYDKSDFAPAGPLLEDDDQLEEIWKSEHPLKDIVDPKNFKSYEELKTKLFSTLGLDGSKRAPTTTAAEDDDEGMDFTPKFKERSAPDMAEASSPSIDEDDDDSLSFFKNLADD